MLSVLISWIYIGLLCALTGLVVLRLAEKISAADGKADLAFILMAGVMGISVYAEYFSIFYKVGAVCHLVFLAVLLLCYAKSRTLRKRFRTLLAALRAETCSFTGFACFLLVLLLAFASSRGTFHTDTGIYHAQAIRIIEEYGVVKGIGNLQQHFGYNSAYLPFCAFFTGSWILPMALHTTTGFLAAVCTVYSTRGVVKAVRERSGAASATGNFAGKPMTGSWARVGAYIALLIYVFGNFTGLMSPATDYGTMLCAGFLLCKILDVLTGYSAGTTPAAGAEANPAGSRNIDGQVHPEKVKFINLCFLCVFALFVASMKLSAAFIVLIALIPILMSIRNRKGKVLLRFVLAGILAFLPYLIRNVIISGWLFYPVGAIDLFDVEWKVPLPYLQHDEDQIKVWGRCLYDVAKIDLPLREWIPVWWEGQTHYGRMLIYANILGVCIAFAALLLALRNQRMQNKTQPAVSMAFRLEILWYMLVIYVCIAVWFFTAPFIRYGLIFLLAAPLVAIGLFAEEAIQYRRAEILNRMAGMADRDDIANDEGNADGTGNPVKASKTAGRGIFPNLLRVLGTFAAVCCIVCFSSWIDNYAMDDLVFVKHNLREPYYITQKPFDSPQMASIDLNGNTVWYALEEDKSSYYVFPSSCYKHMLDRTELIGDRIEDGFKAK